MLDALAFGGEAAAPVETVHGTVNRLMRPPQVRRHQVGVVEIGESRSRMHGTGIQNPLCQWLKPGQVSTL